MSEELDTGDGAGTGVLPIEHGLAKVFDPADFEAKEEAPKNFTSDHHGLAEAAAELVKRRRQS